MSPEDTKEDTNKHNIKMQKVHLNLLCKETIL